MRGRLENSVRTRVSLVFFLASLSGCLGHTFSVGNREFSLSTVESSLAQEYVDGDSRTGASGARCTYWKGRAVDAKGSHKVGTVTWPADNFRTLEEWANAQASDVCAKADAEVAEATRQRDAAAQKKAEQDAADLKRANGEKAWLSLRIDDCVHPVVQTSVKVNEACRPIAQFARDFPDDRHANEAKRVADAGFANANRLEADEKSRLAAAEASQRAEADKEAARIRAAEEAKRKADEAARARGACVQACGRDCAGDASCKQGCVKVKCGG